MDANLQAVLRGGGWEDVAVFLVNNGRLQFMLVVRSLREALPMLLLFEWEGAGRFHGVQTVEELRGFLGEMVLVRGR